MLTAADTDMISKLFHELQVTVDVPSTMLDSGAPIVIGRWHCHTLHRKVGSSGPFPRSTVTGSAEKSLQEIVKRSPVGQTLNS